MDTLRDFILAEMRKRYMSEREFGRLVGVAHTTIGYVLNPERSKGRELTATFVIKLARATNTNVIENPGGDTPLQRGEEAGYSFRFNMLTV